MKSNLSKGAIALTSTVVALTALPAQSALLVSSSGDNSIKQYDEITGAYIRDFVTSGSGGLLNPQGLTLGANGNLFVSSFGTDSIKEYSGTSGEYIRDFVSSSDGLIAPQGLTFAEDGSLYVISSRIPGAEVSPAPGIVYDSGGVLQYDGATGELLRGIPTVVLGLPSGPEPNDVALSTGQKLANKG